MGVTVVVNVLWMTISVVIVPSMKQRVVMALATGRRDVSIFVVPLHQSFPCPQNHHTVPRPQNRPQNQVVPVEVPKHQVEVPKHPMDRLSPHRGTASPKKSSGSSTKAT